MADESDVEAALREAVQAIRDTAFPGVACYRGWPAAALLDTTLAANGSVITICMRPGSFFRNTTRYLSNQTVVRSPVTLTATVSGATVTFAGTGCVGAAGVLVGSIGYSVRMTAADTPATVAAALAAIIPGASVTSGSVLTIATIRLILARIGADATVARTIANIEQQFAVIAWCALPADRDRIMSATAAALADQPFLPLADGSRGRIRSAGGMSSDKGQAASLYRRDLYYSVDYPITVTTTAPTVLFPGLVFHGGQDVQIGADAAVSAAVIAPGVLLPDSTASVSSYATTITGNGLDSVFTIVHGLRTTDVFVEIRDPLDGNAKVSGVDDRAPTDTTVEIIFGAPLAIGASFRVIISRM